MVYQLLMIQDIFVWISILKVTRKGTACEYLCQKLNIPKENTYAFGDGENDIEMLHLVGTSIAMGNADDEVKKHASTVTLTVDEDGIADFFEKDLKSNEN